MLRARPHRQIVLGGEVRVRVHFREQIAVTLKEPGSQDPGSQILAQALRYGTLTQVRFFEELAAFAGLLSDGAFQFHHHSRVAIHHFKNLLRCCGYTVQVVRVDSLA